MTATELEPTKVDDFRDQLEALSATQRELDAVRLAVSVLADQRAAQVSALRLAGVPQWVIANELGITTGAVGHLTRRVRESIR